jgi:RNA polymerase sigma-70 factor (ECF subfamily)
VPAADLEDHAHEVFLVLHNKWAEYDPTRPLRPYLFGIAFRIAASRRRRRWREVPFEIEEPAAPEADPDEAIVAAEARDLVLRALAQVPLPRRAVLVMHDVDEMPMRDIAEALSLPVFTGYSRLRKARREFEVAVRELQKGTREP